MKLAVCLSTGITPLCRVAVIFGPLFPHVARVLRTRVHPRSHCKQNAADAFCRTYSTRVRPADSNRRQSTKSRVRS